MVQSPYLLFIMYQALIDLCIEVMYEFILKAMKKNTVTFFSPLLDHLNGTLVRNLSIDKMLPAGLSYVWLYKTFEISTYAV